MEHEVDARWLMAYNAALGETDPRCYDTASAAGPLAHPLFPVCYEWPVSQPIRQIPQLREFFPRLVHAEHDLVIHRAPRAGDRLSTAVTIAAVDGRKPGAFVVFRFETRDARGERVTTTDFGVVYRGVAVDGPRRGEISELPQASSQLADVGRIDVAANAAHVYTECARIFNPIHTDIAHARAAGLPDIILHGTATLALSVSVVLRNRNIDPLAARRVRCRFTGMVRMPSILQVLGADDGSFETRGPGGETVIGRGRIDHD